MLPWKVSLDSNVRSFQYKVLNNVLYLNKRLFIFGKAPSSLCSFCKQADETILHFFYECNITKELWKRLDLFFNDCFHLPQLLPQTAFFGFLNGYSNNLILKSHILLLFKICLYNFRKQEKVKLRKLIRIITRLKTLGKKVLETMIKRLCCARTNGKILNICYLFLKETLC